MNQVRCPRYFAADSPWCDRPFPERRRQVVGAEPGTREGVLLVDTTDMPKQGGAFGGGGPVSTAVGRLGGQLPGRGVHGLCRGRRGHAGPPAAVPGPRPGPGTRPMRSGSNAVGCRRRPWPSAPSHNWPRELTELVAEGSLPARWVSCDEGYGRSVDFLDGVAALGLAYLTGARRAIETCFREGKQLLGLGDYEGRSWQGWHRHMTLLHAPALLPAAGQAGPQKKTARPDAVPGGGGPGHRAGPVSPLAAGRAREAGGGS